MNSERKHSIPRVADCGGNGKSMGNRDKKEFLFKKPIKRRVLHNDDQMLSTKYFIYTHIHTPSCCKSVETSTLTLSSVP